MKPKFFVIVISLTITSLLFSILSSSSLAQASPSSGNLFDTGESDGETWLSDLTEKSYLPMVSKYAYTCTDHPVLLWPRHGSTINTLIPNYLWDTCDLPGAIEIELMVSPNPDLSDWVLGLASFPTGIGSYQDIENRAPNTTYYWQIRARYTNEDYGPASSGSFRTPASGVLLPPPVLTSPVDGSQLDGTTVTLTWQPVTGAEKYQVVISNPEKTSLYYMWVYGTEYTFPYLEQNKPYIWFVSATNEYAIGQPSEAWDFTSGTMLQATNEPVSSRMDGGLHSLFWLPQSQWVKVIGE